MSLQAWGQVPHHQVGRQGRVEQEADLPVNDVTRLRAQEVSAVGLNNKH